MPCYHPLRAFKDGVTDAGKMRLSWSMKGTEGEAIYLPCGQCIGCRLERSRQWALRCMHEAEMHDENCFVTLTYDDAHLPKDGSLVVAHFQAFMKRFRKRVGKVRFFHCGEYGETLGRPHYHALVFGYDFPDKVLLKEEGGNRLFISPLLTELWPFGFSTVGMLTFESAAYVARYSLKKVTGESADAHYAGRRPEYVTMSRRPGIGHDWLEKYSADVYPSDEVIVRGRACKPPRFYDNWLDKVDREKLESVKMARENAGRRYDPFSLVNREENKRAQMRTMKRRVE